jgi:8-oxo-dGTP pyrophosphatase MutT (NUDIX family)
VAASAIILVSTLVERDGKILMIQEGKNNRGQRGQWNFPAGQVEIGEDLPTAAARETLEETGYHVKIDGIYAIQKKDFGGDWMGATFFFKGSLMDENREPEEPNILKIEWIALNDIANLPLRFPDLADIAKTTIRGEAADLNLLRYLPEVRK